MLYNIWQVEVCAEVIRVAAPHQLQHFGEQALHHT